MKKIIGGSIAVIILIIVLFVLLSSKKSEAPTTVGSQEEPGTLSGVIDPETTQITYTGFGVGKQHTGMFPLSDASMVMVTEDGTIQGGELIFDMITLTSDSEKLTQHLMGEDFFNVKKFPTAHYTISEITSDSSNSENNIAINGELTLVGNTHPHNIVATYEPTTGILKFSTLIDRTMWGISFNSSKIGEFGDALIQDKVQIDAVIDID